MLIEAIQLKNLIISPENLRVVNSNKKDDKQLISSIKQHGILQNLVVIKASKKNAFEVIAGGRRLAALKLLAEEGEIEKTQAVPCTIRTREEATELSLSENLFAPMHPADVFSGYKKLQDEGKTVTEISLAFGHSKNEVKKLLKLGTVAPELINHFREGKLNQDQIMAYTVTDDQEQQTACFKKLGSHCNPHAIRSELTKKALKSTDTLCKFVTLAAYKKAGGTTTSDLFESTVYLHDAALLEKLANEKLEAEAEKISASTSWVATSTEGYNADDSYTRLPSTYENVPKELEEKIASTQEAINAYYNSDEEWTEESSELADKLKNDLEKLEEEKEKYKVCDPEYANICGTVVTFNHNGETILLNNLAKKEDYKSLQQSKKQNSETNSEQDETQEQPAQEEPEVNESNALTMDLHNYYNLAFQAALLEHQNLAKDLFIYTAAQNLFIDEYFESIISITTNQQAPSALNIEVTQAAENISKFKASLNLAFTELEEPDAFASFCELSDQEKENILHYCIAVSSSTELPADASDIQHAATNHMQFNIAKYWQPTAENYFNRINKSALLSIIKNAVSEEIAESYANKGKKDLVIAIEELPQFENWQPETMK